MNDELLIDLPDKCASVELEERDHYITVRVRDDQVPQELVSQMLGAICMGTALCACIPVERVVVDRPKATTGALSCRIPLPRQRPREWRAHHARIAGTVAATTLTAWGFDVHASEVKDGKEDGGGQAPAAGG